MVVKSSKHHEGPIIAANTHASNHHNRCFKAGVWLHVGKHFIQGIWSESQQELHINLLELETVFLTLKHFLPLLENKNILVRSNSTTVVQYINKQGWTRSLPLCYRTWDLWNFAINKSFSYQDTPPPRSLLVCILNFDNKTSKIFSKCNHLFGRNTFCT